MNKVNKILLLLRIIRAKNNKVHWGLTMEGQQYSTDQMPAQRYTNTPPTAPYMYSNGPFNLTTVSTGAGVSGVFPSTMSTAARNTCVARETVTLDTSVVVNERDRRTVDKVNFALINIDLKVPLFTRKKIEDMGNAYRITFNWEDTWFIVSLVTANTKLLNIEGVKDVQISDRSIVVIISKTVTQDDYGVLMQGAEDELTSSYDTTSGIRLTYKALDLEGKRILALMDGMCKDMPEAQRGLVLKAVREKIARDTQKNNKKSKKSRNPRTRMRTRSSKRNEDRKKKPKRSGSKR